MPQSIFGDTMDGVPSPYVPHKHPYPTRYHGPIFASPRFRQPYRARPHYIGAPMGVSPDGIGQMSLPTVTRSPVADALIGALVGWLGAPSRDQALVYAIGGAGVTYFTGLIGLGSIVGLELWKSQEQGGLRPDLHGG